ncbi:protein-tyrosine phosphatase family protein [Nocardioides zeae]|uniref:Dual specificity protein phosphatase family protein n=1 Tax=Nocardioides zeae TaxID=1457234 RepID=A0A6P0HDV1_9ACTN|nr:dual specificity protein phosphatase [Nocardioides zeae]NEN76913.1 dual specificity protein phosphatase family protein [Nocardioides zeae]
MDGTPETGDRLQWADADTVTDFLLVGGDLATDEVRALAQADELTAAGVTHVLDARAEAADGDVWEAFPGVTYHWDGIEDAGQPVGRAWFDAVATFARTALAAPGARLLTHCHLGVNRGPSAAYAVLLDRGWDPVDALDAIRGARPVAAVAYADDALDWHLARRGAGWFERRRTRARVEEWRRDHPLDVPEVLQAGLAARHAGERGWSLGTGVAVGA